MSKDEMKSNSTKSSVTRRNFLSAGATAAVAPMILPSGVLAAKGRPGANDKLVIGIIGCGGQGGAHLNFLSGRKDVHLAAVCDVYDKNRQKGVDVSGGKAQGYKDYRKLLERKDLDAALGKTASNPFGGTCKQPIATAKDCVLFMQNNRQT